MAVTRTEGGEVNEDEWNGSVRVCVYVYVYVYVYLRLCLCVCLCLSTWSGPQYLALPGLPPNSWQPRGCGSVAFAAAVALLSLALRSMNDTPMHLHAPCEHT